MNACFLQTIVLYYALSESQRGIMKKIIVSFVAMMLLVTFGCKKKTEFSQVNEKPNASEEMKDPHAGLGIPSPSEMRAESESGAQPNTGAIPPPPNQPANGGLDLLSLEKSVPSGVTKSVPSSTMRIGQYTLKKQSGDSEDGDLAVFYFGPNAGGIQANIERWFNQFTNRKGESTSSFVTDSKLKGTIAEVTGDIQSSATMGGVATDKPNWRLYGVILETPAGPYFFKAVGPDKTVKFYRDAMKKWFSKATIVQGTVHSN